jgi:chromosomal replication initiator protein
MINLIIKSVCQDFNCDPDLLKTKTRKREVLLPRQVSIYLIREIAKMKLDDITIMFQYANHSSTLHCIKTIDNLIDTDVKFALRIELLRNYIEKKHKIGPVPKTSSLTGRYRIGRYHKVTVPIYRRAV